MEKDWRLPGVMGTFAFGKLKKIPLVSEYAEKQKSMKGVEIKPRIFELLRKELGDFEIVL